MLRQTGEPQREKENHVYPKGRIIIALATNIPCRYNYERQTEARHNWHNPPDLTEDSDDFHWIYR